MKTSLIIAALAAALITGSTASTQAIPAAPLSKSIQQNSSSLVENVLIRRGYRGYGVYRGYRHVGLYRGYRRLVSAFTGVTGVSAITDTRSYRGYRWGGVTLYRNRGCW